MVQLVLSNKFQYDDTISKTTKMYPIQKMSYSIYQKCFSCANNILKYRSELETKHLLVSWVLVLIVKQEIHQDACTVFSIGCYGDVGGSWMEGEYFWFRMQTANTIQSIWLFLVVRLCTLSKYTKLGILLFGLLHTVVNFYEYRTTVTIVQEAVC